MFDICHGCRRCFSLCNAFPTLFDAVDATSEGEVAAVDRKVFWEVVDHCYLCDMCFMTKCPYVPPHPWNVDFPHLMLRAKAVRARSDGIGSRERAARGHRHGRHARRHPGGGRSGQRARIAPPPGACCSRRHSASIAPRPLPDYQRAQRAQAPGTARHHARPGAARGAAARAAADRRHQRPRGAVHHLLRQSQRAASSMRTWPRCFEHNGIEVALLPQERCCGMPRLELGDLEGVAQLKEYNIPQLVAGGRCRLRHRGADSLAAC